MTNTKEVELIGGLIFEINETTNFLWSGAVNNFGCDIPPCNPENSCDVIQEFIKEEEL